MKYPNGVPIFMDRVGHVLAGADILSGHRIQVWCDGCDWFEQYPWWQLYPANKDGREMLAIARSKRV